jgi:hypothetical protein
MNTARTKAKSVRQLKKKAKRGSKNKGKEKEIKMKNKYTKQ